MASYEDVLSSEIEKYKDYEVSSSACAEYVCSKYLRKILTERFGWSGFLPMIEGYARELTATRAGQPLRILSLGSGNCDIEMQLAGLNGLDCQFECLDINPHMAARAADRAESLGQSSRFVFRTLDINRLQLDKTYDIVLANHSLHHLVELEHIFSQVHEAMHPGSFFLVNDMIGRNGHMFWDSTLDMTNRLWSLLPRGLKHNRQTMMYTPLRHQFDQSVANFEGVRAQDILPALDQVFVFRDFAPFFALVNRFFDRDFGPNYDMDDPLQRATIDMIIELDEFVCRQRLLKPTQMLACLVRRDAPVQEKRWLHFETPAQVTNLDDQKLFDVFEPLAPVNLDEQQPSLARLMLLLRLTVTHALLLLRSQPAGLKLVRWCRRRLLALRQQWLR